MAVQFESQYVAAIEACLRRRLPLVVCTIYNGSFADAAFQRVATVFVALQRRDRADGEKISRAVAAVVTGDALRTPATRVTLA